MNDWIYIDEIKDISDAKEIICDTRDFHINILTTDLDDEASPLEMCEPLFKGHTEIFEKCLFKEEEVLPWLKSLEESSGGKRNWRCLQFKVARENWIKYIRLYKFNYNGEDRFFAHTEPCKEDYYPLRKDVYVPESVINQYL